MTDDLLGPNFKGKGINKEKLTVVDGIPIWRKNKLSSCTLVLALKKKSISWPALCYILLELANVILYINPIMKILCREIIQQNLFLKPQETVLHANDLEF